jgi:ABC-type Fe3+ transport system substrate-binding protein
MWKVWTIVGALALVLALPFAMRRQAATDAWKSGDPVLVIISPHNEAIRQEFSWGFSAWHQREYGGPVRIDWRVIGGTTEIIRYLESEFITSFRGWWGGQGKTWPAGGGDMILDRRFKAAPVPEAVKTNDAERLRWEAKAELHAAFRAKDDPAAFGAGVDLMYGGGAYDHGKMSGEGLVVPPWPRGSEPAGLLTGADGTVLVPEKMSGESWRTATYFATALSTFGICYNRDRLRDLGVTNPPARWEDLADPVWFGQIGLADPTKSGSIAKAFEMIVQEQCWQAVSAAGFTTSQVASFEARIEKERMSEGRLPDGVPPAYQESVERGWRNGVNLVRRIGANARYFTDSASKVPIDVSMGDAAAGVAIDFYGRYQAEVSAGPGGPRMVFVTPAGGSSVSADPISLLRGAPHRDLAVKFIAYALSEEGQRLWNYRPGEPGGPRKFALRRLPVRRDFYPSASPGAQAAHEKHRRHASDDLADPAIDPYAIASTFEYQPRWTGGHFSVHRNLIRAMCMDSGEELKAAWRAILDGGGPAAQPDAVVLLERLPDVPEPLNWRSAPAIDRANKAHDLMREWTRFFRRSYDEARAAAGQ